ncbi:hypothetical protein [Bradyrhizobium sp. I1.14.4]|uniref:hypothetical protein n=1 Tax=unclassified Bradyrhizobium TaxID=2631580 RepID=UPI003D255C6C
MAKASALNFGAAWVSVLTLLICGTISRRLEGVIARCGNENQSKSSVSLCCGARKKSLFRHIEALGVAFGGVAFGVPALSVSGDNGLKR